MKLLLMLFLFSSLTASATDLLITEFTCSGPPESETKVIIHRSLPENLHKMTVQIKGVDVLTQPVERHIRYHYENREHYFDFLGEAAFLKILSVEDDASEIKFKRKGHPMVQLKSCLHYFTELPLSVHF